MTLECSTTATTPASKFNSIVEGPGNLGCM